MQESQIELHHRAGSSSRNVLPVATNMSETTQELGRVENGYAEHAKRLTTYTKTAILITISLLVAFYSTSLDKQEKRIFILASFTSLLLSLFFELVLLVLIGCVERPDPNCFHCRYEEQMYFFIYGSNLLLMLTAWFLLLLCTSRYAFLSIFLILALPVIISILYRAKWKHTETIQKYREHDSELNCLSELSAAVVIMLFAGLSSIVFSSPTMPRQNLQIKVTECFLYITIIMSLLLMLLTSVPPAVPQPTTRIRMVGAVKSLAYTIVSLLALVGLLAACEILQGFVVISISVHIAGAMYWFVTELGFGLPDQASGGTEQVTRELDSLSMVLTGGTFSVLMLLYSKNVDSIELYSRWAYFPLLAVCMLSLCSTFISCLSKTVIFSYSPMTRPWKSAEVILNYITYPSLFIATLSSFLHAVYRNYAV